ncbi:HigA family addiction module antidote protein [Xenorhabdus bovienii]|uniref:HigA family addiction module antitoxin n=1 Tax=Xenorhabdus bovienii TaxID=40576 RepID=UPI001EE0763D|nr:HigA family addiction module antitoxin [Xenorhabdus bovienii]MCG3462654.1 HigA family addiction module antitoxin [Xenorhabdus bovienii]MDE9437390.1 HigA family addiction module antidote protein [Xenorhabdus bovienii]MDE9455328.1 HigA family addiction module antidote protein [Xenorhabdus bovienii]MDE9464655.1 HigA family addiction module antidote protein [Xenorhabdus bovienii]MDE9499261.1 HigA family addiction module antidote protein [Xenorhabdus bovienii]
MSTMHNPPHPGELIKETMEALNMSARALAQALDVAPSTVQRLISCQSHVSPEMAVRLSVVIGSAPHVWLGMQNAYDIWHIKQNLDTSRLQRLSVA